MKSLQRRQSLAVTLTELLVVLVIISILATAAVPVYVNQTARAKVATATDEVKTIAEALDRVAVLYDFYVPIQLLDDIPGDSGTSGLDSNSDAIGNETSVYLVNFNVPIGDLDSTAQVLVTDSTDVRAENIVDSWEGPFLSPQRVYMGDYTSIDDVMDSSVNLYDHPLDPWGQPYRLYSPIGLVGSSASSTDSDSWDSSGFSDGNLTSTDDRFDRWAVVSFGPDGESNTDSGSTTDDDIVYLFGTVINETNY